MKRALLLFLSLVLLPHLQAIEPRVSKNPKHYLIPEQHHVKLFLDKLIPATNALQDPKHFAKAGFQTVCFRSRGSLWVAKHPELPGYIFKVYLNDTTRQASLKYKYLARRAAIATEVRKLIQKHKMQHITVPSKWLYEIPGQAANVKKRYLLVVDDMQLVSRNKSRKAWKKKVTPEVLRELYHILHAGYTSLSVSQNIPYTKQKTFSCIDTEYESREFDLLELCRSLSPKMRTEWKKIIREHQAK